MSDDRILRIFENIDNFQGGEVTVDEFVSFISALCEDPSKADKGLEHALTIDVGQLKNAIKNFSGSDDYSACLTWLQELPIRITKIIQLAQIVFSDPALVNQAIAPFLNPGSSDDDDYYDQGEDSDGH